jgi:hypothetical protein
MEKRGASKIIDVPIGYELDPIAESESTTE